MPSVGSFPHNQRFSLTGSMSCKSSIPFTPKPPKRKAFYRARSELVRSWSLRFWIIATFSDARAWECRAPVEGVTKLDAQTRVPCLRLTDMTISLQLAEETDLPPIVALMNAAFRGAESARGWSIEGDYITGSRTSESLLREEIAEGAHLLLAKDDATSILQGCVSLQVSSTDKWYLGSLTVSPSLQNIGFGRKLLDAAEQYAAIRGARTIEMTVVSVRDALIAWYEVEAIGERARSVPYGDHRFGTPTRSDRDDGFSLTYLKLRFFLLIPPSPARYGRNIFR
jgi:ribosomal protein S18 acetylase RimI-like enzyme